MNKVNDVIIDGYPSWQGLKESKWRPKAENFKVGYFRDTSASGNHTAKIWCFSLLMLFIWVFVSFNPATRKWNLSMRFGTKLSVCWRLDQKSCKWSDLGAATTRSWQRILYFTGLIVFCMFLAKSKAWRAQFLNCLHVNRNARPSSSFFELLDPTVSYVGLKMLGCHNYYDILQPHLPVRFLSLQFESY